MRGVIFPVSYILNNCNDAVVAFPNDISKFHKALHLKWWQHYLQRHYSSLTQIAEK